MTQPEQTRKGCRFERSAEEGHYALTGDLGFDCAVSILAQGEAAFAGKAEVVVDLSGVTDADSAGLAVLIEWTRRCSIAERRISFRRIPSRLGAIARIGGLSQLLPVEA
jgi:phospholipid transport system transporter-binding protein